jgi:hypothetical protein
VVPGYLPRAQNLGLVNPFLPLRVSLDTTRFARPEGPAPGRPAIAVTRAPACGRLSGDAPELRYVPGSECSGVVTFEFGARDASSQFPTSTPTATVRFRLGSRRALSPTRLTRRGRELAVRMRSRYRGRLRATALGTRGRLGSCTARARARRRTRCTIRLRPGAGRRGLRVRTALVMRGRTVARRVDRLGSSGPPRPVR